MLARESLWRLSVPNAPSERALLSERRKELVMSAYAVYSDVEGLRDFDVYVQPVLRTIAPQQEGHPLLRHAPRPGELPDTG